MSDEWQIKDAYYRLPSVSEVIPKRNKRPRTLDLRTLDEMAKRGSFDGINRPPGAPPYVQTRRLSFMQRLHVISKIIGPERASEYVLGCKEAEYRKRLENSKDDSGSTANHGNTRGN